MPPKMTWQFPRNEFEENEGFTDAGISHFTDNREVNLVRESIQNSLDARAGADPVKVECSLVDIPLTAFQGSELRGIIDRVIQSPHNDDKGSRQFGRAKRLLDYNQQLSALRIKDSNTTGAVDVPRDGGNISQWEALTKGSGSPVKRQANAGGSFGLGKHSAFAVTDLRTVLYSTAWRDSSGLKRRFIGKAILVSHIDGQGVPRRRTGYLSSGESNAPPFKDGNVPYTFGLTEPGTAVYIPGYELPPDQGRFGWQQQSIATVIDNYFHAIVHGNLIVVVDDKEVNADNIGEEYNALATGKRSARTTNFIRVSKMTPVATEHFAGIGNVALRVLVDDNPKSKVREIALVRDSGMMITARPADTELRLGRIPQAWRGFTAIIECISEPGKSSYIRDSESPKHDKLSVDFIEDSNRRRDARSALRELGQWVQERIRKEAGLQVPDSDDYVDELAKYLPIYGEGGPLGDTDRPGHVSISAPRQSRHTSGGAGLLAGEHGGRRGGRRRPRNEGGTGGPGGRSGGRGPTGSNRRPPISRVSGIRIQPVRGETHWVTAAFDDPGEALTEVRLVAVGEDGSEHRLTIQQAKFGDTMVDVSDGAIRRLPNMGEARYQLEIKANEPVHGKTFRLVGRSPVNPQASGDSG